MSENHIHPREVADKSIKGNLYRALDLALKVESDALRLNTQTFNTNRYKAIGRLDDYDSLKDHARKIKEDSIKNLPSLIKTLTKAIESRGGKVFYAKSKSEASDYVKDVCKSHSAKLVVKAKSITSEEIELNRTLEKENIEVAETDLAEFILQVSKEQPSHIVAPAIHRSRERISKLFKENFKTDKPLETGEQLTEFARDILRQKFLSADIGISGANLIAAEEGTILLVESEGNIRLTTHLPAVHIAIAGIEKIIPSKKEFGTFIELLASSGTGQPLSSYTNILEPPLNLPILNLNNRDDKEREFHLVLVDNGRMRMREDPDFREALYCIRCSACMNVCANFQTVGGHAFGGECYTGGIGGAWTVGTSGKLENGRFAELCTGCSRCVPNCPVRIDIPRLNTTIKNRLIKAGEPSFQKKFFGNFSTLAKFASIAPSLSNWISSLNPSRLLFEKLVGFEKQRPMPAFAERTFINQYKMRPKLPPIYSNKNLQSLKVLLFADVYTNYNNPQVGMAAINVFEKLGIKITLGEVMEDGRAAQSQGLVESAEKSARAISSYLGKFVNNGYEIIFTEPSVLAMVRYDYQKLINNEVLFQKIKSRCYDPIEYLNKIINDGMLEIDSLKKLFRPFDKKIFYHGHCQMKSIGIGDATPVFLNRLGIGTSVSTVECCGMAGSFGYKKQYYELSKNIGHELVRQIQDLNISSGDLIILASGTSCREQIHGELKQVVYHPIEFVNSIME